jgi:aminoglycoside phosphotransferase (APT) family kinase protein
MNTDFRDIAGWLAAQAGAASVLVDDLRRLSGGAIQENWAADLVIDGGPHEGTVPVVIRCDAPSGVGDSHSRAQEFALLRAAFDAGVTVPEPLWRGDKSVFGRDFFVMRRVQGTAAGHRLVKEAAPGGDRRALTRRLGEEIARIQRVQPSADLTFLERPATHPARHFVAKSRAFLDAYHTPYPALEWVLRWLDNNVPDAGAWMPAQLVLAHRDFRTGNYMVDAQGLTAVLDWEFAAWSHPLEDLGWLCARCWRFGQQGEDRAAGGIGSRADLLAGYNAVSGRNVQPADLYYWEVFGELRWAMIAIDQGERHISGRERGLELALTSHIVPELELNLLRMTGIDFAREGQGHA